MEVVVAQMATVTCDGISGITGTAVRVRKFDVAHYLEEDLLHKANQINDHENLLQGISDVHVLSLAQSIRAYGLDRGRGTLHVASITIESRFEMYEGASTATAHVLVAAAFVDFQDGRNRLQELYGLQNATEVPRHDASLLMRCAKSRGEHAIAETDTLKLNNLANKSTSFVRCN